MGDGPLGVGGGGGGRRGRPGVALSQKAESPGPYVEKVSLATGSPAAGFADAPVARRSRDAWAAGRPRRHRRRARPRRARAGRDPADAPAARLVGGRGSALGGPVGHTPPAPVAPGPPLIDHGDGGRPPARPPRLADAGGPGVLAPLDDLLEPLEAADHGETVRPQVPPSPPRPSVRRGRRRHDRVPRGPSLVPGVAVQSVGPSGVGALRGIAAVAGGRSRGPRAAGAPAVPHRRIPDGRGDGGGVERGKGRGVGLKRQSPRVGDGAGRCAQAAATGPGPDVGA